MSHHTVDFTSHGTPVGVAAGNLWLVWLATYTLQPMEHTNHKFPAAMATAVPCEVKLIVTFCSQLVSNDCFKHLATKIARSRLATDLLHSQIIHSDDVFSLANVMTTPTLPTEVVLLYE